MSRTKVAAILFLGCFSSFAGIMGPISENPTTKSWRFGGKALYLQESWGTLTYPSFTPINISMDRFFNQTGIWGRGYMLEGDYHFTENNDVNLNWYHQNLNNAQILSNTTSSLTPVSGALAARLVFQPKWNAVNLEFGHLVNYTPALNVRYHAGVEYTNIVYKRYTYRVIDGWGRVNRLYTYNGFGPRAGIDAGYGLGYHLSAYAKAAIGLYAGSSRFTLDLSQLPIAGTGKMGSSMAVVPELESKLGVNYQVPSTHLNVDAGWMWISYLNPITYGDNGLVRATNFGLQGPYLGLNWKGDLA